MTFKTLVGTIILVVVSFAAAPFALANETASEAIPSEGIVVSTETSPVITVALSDEALTAELKSLKMKEQDTSLGFFTRLIIGFKVKQLENQLNIKKALK